MWVKKQQLEPDIELIGLKLKKEYNKAVYCHPASLIYMQCVCVCVCCVCVCVLVTQLCLTLAYTCEMLGWMNHKLESRLLAEIINNLRYADNSTLMAESKEEVKSLLMRVKEESEKLA